MRTEPRIVSCKARKPHRVSLAWRCYSTYMCIYSLHRSSHPKIYIDALIFVLAAPRKSMK